MSHTTWGSRMRKHFFQHSAGLAEFVAGWIRRQRGLICLSVCLDHQKASLFVSLACHTYRQNCTHIGFCHTTDGWTDRQTDIGYLCDVSDICWNLSVSED